jgi:putative transcriptional regulator
MQVSNRVREVRSAADLTQAALAEMVGVTRQTIISIEQVGYTPSIKLGLQLARALQTPVEELFWLEPDQRKS